MLKKIFKKLDEWIVEENRRALDEGLAPIQETMVLVIGQTALLEADLNIQINATMDVDTYNELTHRVRDKLNELLTSIHKSLDPEGHKAWMPEETQYQSIYKGQFVDAKIAEPVFIMLSKAKMAPTKNKQLLTDYLASEDCDDLIYDLADKYNVDLETIL